MLSVGEAISALRQKMIEQTVSAWNVSLYFQQFGELPSLKMTNIPGNLGWYFLDVVVIK